MLKRIIISLSLFGATLPAWTGATGAQREQLRDEFHQTYPLAASGRVTLHNINGAVHIQGWERNEVRVDAVKRAYTRARLDEARIEVNADADGIQIRTRYPDEEQTWDDDEPHRYNNPASVEYTLSVPRAARLENIELINGNLDLADLSGEVNASSINGKLSARNLSGEAKLSTINGTLDAAFNQLNGAKPITLGSVNGTVLLTVPSDANADVRASTIHGEITNEFGLPVHHGRFVGNDLAGQLGTGGARIRLNNVNGTIQIRHASDGRSISRASNLLTSTSDEESYGPSSAEIQRQVAREVEQAQRAAEREAERARTEAEREAERERSETQREAEQEKAEAAREQADAQRAAEEERREAEREKAEAQREAQRERAEAQREAERERVEAQREQEEAAREVARAQRDAERERERALRDADRARAEAERESFNADSDNGYPLVERQTMNYKVSGTPLVRLETFDGPVTVEAWHRPEVECTAIKRARDERAQHATSVNAHQTGNEITITAVYDKAQERAEPNIGAMVALEVRVPRDSNLNLHTGDGHVRLAGVSGELDLRTGDGAVDVSDGHGRLHVETGDGRVRVTSFNGEAFAQTGDGRITLDGRFTRLTAHTNDGGISLTLPPDADATIETDASLVVDDGLAVSADNSKDEQRVRHWRVGRGTGQINLRTGDGSIYLRRADSAAVVH